MHISDQKGALSFATQKTENEDEKREKKPKLVRNEFKTASKYGIPFIKKQNLEKE